MDYRTTLDSFVDKIVAVEHAAREQRVLSARETRELATFALWIPPKERRIWRTLNSTRVATLDPAPVRTYAGAADAELSVHIWLSIHLTEAPAWPKDLTVLDKNRLTISPFCGSSKESA